MPANPLSPDGPFGRFADQLLGFELPDLPADRRHAAVAFVCRRAEQVPTPLRVGVVTLSIATGIGQRLIGDNKTTAFLRATHLPFVGELARMVRSLGFAYIWETWPSTSPTGGAMSDAIDGAT